MDDKQWKCIDNGQTCLTPVQEPCNCSSPVATFHKANLTSRRCTSHNAPRHKTESHRPFQRRSRRCCSGIYQHTIDELSGSLLDRKIGLFCRSMTVRYSCTCCRHGNPRVETTKSVDPSTLSHTAQLEDWMTYTSCFGGTDMPWYRSNVRRVPKLNNCLDCAQGQRWRFLAETTSQLLEDVY